MSTYLLRLSARLERHVLPQGLSWNVDRFISYNYGHGRPSRKAGQRTFEEDRNKKRHKQDDGAAAKLSSEETKKMREEVLSIIFQNDILPAESHDKDMWEKVELSFKQKRLHNWPLVMLSYLSISACVPPQKVKPIAFSLLEYMCTVPHYSKFITNRGVMLCKMLILSKDQQSENEVFRMYEEAFSDVIMLDSKSGELLIQSFCNTTRWKDSFKFLPLLTKFDVSWKARHLHPIAEAAIRCKDSETLFKVLELSAKLEIQPSPSIVKGITCNFQEHKHMQQLLLYIRDHSLTLSKETCELVKNWFESEPFQGGTWQGVYGSITHEGTCRVCRQALPRLMALSDEKFEELRDACFGETLIGEDLFQNTTPEELERFKVFLNTFGPFDAVVDGLNVGYIKNHKMDNLQAAAVLSLVVQQLVYKHGLKVLILGREHMEGWPGVYFQQCKKIAKVFLTKNVSKDDPFMIYAALWSGRRGCIVTSDYLNDHAYRLKEILPLFRQWQRSHQIVPDVVYFKRMMKTDWEGRVRLKMPATYDCRLTLSDSACHIPYEEGELRTSYSLTNSLLCLKKTKTQQKAS